MLQQRQETTTVKVGFGKGSVHEREEQIRPRLMNSSAPLSICASTGSVMKYFFDLGLCHVRVISNIPLKLQALEETGLKIVERVLIQVESNESAQKYLSTKKKKMETFSSCSAQLLYSKVRWDVVEGTITPRKDLS